MTIIYKYDKSKLYTEDEFIDDNKPTPANATDVQPVGFYTPKWDGAKWIEGAPDEVKKLKAEEKAEKDKEKQKKKDHDDAGLSTPTTLAEAIADIERIKRILNLK